MSPEAGTGVLPARVIAAARRCLGSTRRGIRITGLDVSFWIYCVVERSYHAVPLLYFVVYVIYYEAEAFLLCHRSCGTE